MAQKSKIEWTETTWNPITGCTKISEGCLNCYAEKMANRLKHMHQEKYKNAFNVTLHPQELDKPLKWRKPQVVFVCSMSDLFHKEIPVEFIQNVFNIMNKAKQHTFQVLTKRSDRLLELAPKLNWTPNIWAGVTVESQQYTNRINHLVQVPAFVKFLSIEPMITKIDNISLEGIDWVIVGGESGSNKRPLKEEWVTLIRDECLKSKTPFFFKQWGGVNKKKNGRLLENITWDQQPHHYKQFISIAN